MSRKRMLTETDRALVANTSKFQQLVLKCGSWEELNEEEEMEAVQRLRYLSLATTPSEYACLSDGWAMVRLDGDRTVLDEACNAVLERANEGFERDC